MGGKQNSSTFKVFQGAYEPCYATGGFNLIRELVQGGSTTDWMIVPVGIASTWFRARRGCVWQQVI